MKHCIAYRAGAQNYSELWKLELKYNLVYKHKKWKFSCILEFIQGYYITLVRLKKI